jgi:hypothetical protein
MAALSTVGKRVPQDSGPGLGSVSLLAYTSERSSPQGLRRFVAGGIFDPVFAWDASSLTLREPVALPGAA